MATGTSNPTFDLVIGGQSNAPTLLNPESDTALVEFRDGSGNLLDTYDFDSDSQWNGGASGTSQNGYAWSLTDGSPTTAVGYAWVPVAL